MRAQGAREPIGASDQLAVGQVRVAVRHGDGIGGLEGLCCYPLVDPALEAEVDGGRVPLLDARHLRLGDDGQVADSCRRSVHGGE